MGTKKSEKSEKAEGRENTHEVAASAAFKHPPNAGRLSMLLLEWVVQSPGIRPSAGNSAGNGQSARPRAEGRGPRAEGRGRHLQVVGAAVVVVRQNLVGLVHLRERIAPQPEVIRAICCPRVTRCTAIRGD